MKKQFYVNTAATAMLGLVLLLNVSLLAQGKGGGKGGKGGKEAGPKEKYVVVVEPAESIIQIGDTLVFIAYLQDSLGNRTDTTFDWSVRNSRIGVVDEHGVFTGLARGNTHVIASLGRLSGKAKVRVEAEEGQPGRRGYHINVMPHDTVLIIGQELDYTAILMDSNDTVIDTTFTWRLSRPAVGTLDSNQHFTALAKGQSKVIAAVGQIEGKGNVVVLRDSTAWENRRKGLKIVIEPQNVKLAVGDSLQFAARLVDTLGNVIDTTFRWSVEGGGFGDIDSTGLFLALAEGRGDVFASVGELSGKAKVHVWKHGIKPEPKHGRRLVVEPRDTTLLVGQTVQYVAYIQDTLGVKTETAVEWSMRGKQVGSLTDSGLFTAATRGVGVIAARWQRYSGIAKVMVITEADSAEKDTARIRLHDRDGIQVGNIKRLGEKDVLHLSSLPFPLNIFNGTSLTLPPGSLDEGISIDLTLPDMTVLEGDSNITFQDLIVAGISFDVFVNDSLVSPYTFDPPVHLSLPYKKDLMEELGISVEDLWMFFYNEDGSYDSTGISNVVIDTTENRIEADISHFSQIVIGDGSLCSCTSIDAGLKNQLPKTCRLYGNYPNPFNPVTTIAYDIAGAGLQRVTLEVFNILGQRVSVLVNSKQDAGHYVVQWDGKANGMTAGSGLYFYRLKVNDQIFVNKMSLIR